MCFSNLFQDHDFLENLVWLFVFSVSGYDADRFPHSPVGQVIVTLMPLIGLGSLLALVGLITSDHITHRMLASRGMKATQLKNHIILCGWNDNVPYLARHLVNDDLARKRPVVILANPAEEMPLVKYNLGHDLISFIRGTATRREDLDKANFIEADIAILVADEASSDSDATNILKTLTIETYCRELEQGPRKGRKNIHTIAEISYEQNFPTARDACIDEIISLGEIKSKILVQSALNPGVSVYINEILTFNGRNEFYSIEITADNVLAGLTFDQILQRLRPHRILLLAISTLPEDMAPGTPSSSRKNQLGRSVITNPIDEEEDAYQTSPGDFLIVLAQRQSVIDDALAKLRYQ